MRTKALESKHPREKGTEALSKNPELSESSGVTREAANKPTFQWSDAKTLLSFGSQVMADQQGQNVHVGSVNILRRAMQVFTHSLPLTSVPLAALTVVSGEATP